MYRVCFNNYIKYNLNCKHGIKEKKVTMRCKDIKIEIPGSADILFFAGIKFETNESMLTPVGFGSTPQITSNIPPYGKMEIEYYAFDDLTWINDWMNCVYSYGILPSNDVSPVSRALTYREVKLYYKNCIYTLYDTVPIEVIYDDFAHSTEKFLTSADEDLSVLPKETDKVVFHYNWVRQDFI